MTDSELSRATERWEEPLLGEDTEPETMCLQAVGALWRLRAQGVTACLLHNDPASYRPRLLVKILRIEAIGKPSLNRAILVAGGRRETA